MSAPQNNDNDAVSGLPTTPPVAPVTAQVTPQTTTSPPVIPLFNKTPSLRTTSHGSTNIVDGLDDVVGTADDIAADLHAQEELRRTASIAISARLSRRDGAGTRTLSQTDLDGVAADARNMNAFYNKEGVFADKATNKDGLDDSDDSDDSNELAEDLAELGRLQTKRKQYLLKQAERQQQQRQKLAPTTTLQNQNQNNPTQNNAGKH